MTKDNCPIIGRLVAQVSQLRRELHAAKYVAGTLSLQLDEARDNLAKSNKQNRRLRRKVKELETYGDMIGGWQEQLFRVREIITKCGTGNN